MIDARGKTMPARDRFHEAFKNALIREGWTITHDPLQIKVGKLDMNIDLGAEKVIAAEKEGRKIEIKSFLGVSALNDLYLAVGQFVVYRRAMKREQPDRKLYLAVPAEVGRSFFSMPLLQDVVAEDKIAVIAFDPNLEVITSWRE
jgi:hypothetical protein